jgi:hypothetical protein
MNGQKDFLQRLVDALSNAGIPYMLSGSIGSGFHGQPRATNDVDIVIAPTESQLHSFLQSLGKDYYVSLDAVLEALRCESAFNVIDMQTGWKADFIIRRRRPFSTEEFQRRQKVSIMGLDTWIVSPEDMILIKLEWAKNSKSDRQFEDALGVAMVQFDRLDGDYLHKWAKELQVEGSLKQLLEQAKKRMKLG